jgi:hypothetical protein
MMMAFLPSGNTTIVALAIVSALGVGHAALAQSPSAQAEAMFRDGRTLLDAGQIAEACAAFEASQKLDPAISTLMNLAACRERNGQFATAWGLFLDAEHQTRDATNDATRKLHQVAVNRAKKLEPRVSKLVINVPADSQIDQLELLRDTEAVDPAMWNRALPIDGGKYKITVRAPGAVTWTIEITIVAEGEVKTVEIPRLQPASSPVVAVTVTKDGAATGEVTVTREAAATSRDGVPMPPLVFGASGALLLVGALGLDLWGNSTYDAARAELTDQARRDSLYDSANTKRHIAFGLGATGLACGGIATWLYFTGRSSERTALKSARAQTQVVPMVGGAGSGLVVLGRF